jgi:DNA-directed RNA polymerase subunit N (RpoN/RPB10)
MDEFLPVRCLTCNKALGHLQRPLEALLDKGYSYADAMTELGIIKICCRMRAMSPEIQLHAIQPIYMRETEKQTATPTTTSTTSAPDISVPNIPDPNASNQTVYVAPPKKFTIPKAYFAR